MYFMYAQIVSGSQPTGVQGVAGSQPSAGTPQAPPSPTQAPAPSQAQQPAKQQKPAFHMPEARMIIAAIAIVIVAIAGVMVVLHKPSNTTSTSTTIQVIRVGSVSACGEISKPGNYFLSANIKTAIPSGACINITASDVALVCNLHSIIGSGPYSGVPPFTYGVEISAHNNVSVSGCAIENFSYGVYAQDSSNVVVRNNNLTSNYLSDAYFSGTQNSIMSNNLMSKASSTDGALYLANGSSNNLIYNNTIENNRVYGIGVNSTGNSYINNTLNYNPSSFHCGIANSFPGSSRASGNYCYNNTGCAFVTCGGINTPANLSLIHLGSNVNSCGSVVSPGKYQLTSNLDTSMFENTSNPTFRQSDMPCIRMDTNNTTLDCRGFSITNSAVAILADGRYNITITNCSIRGSGYGVKLSNSTGAYVSNMTFRNDTASLALLNTTSSVISSITSAGSKYGIYLLDSSANNFLGFNASKNQYGIYLSQSVGNLFSKGVAFNNSIIDVYATPDSVNASYNLMQQTSCGLTNTKWAKCNQDVSSGLSYYPLIGCATLNRQGNYTLTANIVGQPAYCMTVNANNVTLDCTGHALSQMSTTPGPAFYINGRNNVTIRNCAIYGYTAGINVSNSSAIAVYDVAVQSSRYGISLSNVNQSAIEGDLVTGAANASIKLSHVSVSSIMNNSFAYGTGSNIGILVNNSQRNIIADNNGRTDYIGMYFTGNSQNNIVVNNTMQLSGHADYVCNGNSGINDEIGGINYGTTKIGCSWMAALLQGATQITCAVALQADTYALQNDAEYNYGATCYSVYANGTTINCNGHTIIATNGGTFASFKNVNNANIENCTLKGFASPIVAVNSGITVFNNKILDNSTTNAAIALTNVSSATVLANNVTASYYGISILRGLDSSLLNNIVALASTAYRISNSIGIEISNNTATGSTGTGMVLSNTTASVITKNRLQAKNSGLICLSGSQGSSSNIDSGGNICTSSTGCGWMQSSSTTCH